MLPCSTEPSSVAERQSPHRDDSAETEQATRLSEGEDTHFLPRRKGAPFRVCQGTCWARVKGLALGERENEAGGTMLCFDPQAGHQQAMRTQEWARIRVLFSKGASLQTVGLLHQRDPEMPRSPYMESKAEVGVGTSGCFPSSGKRRWLTKKALRE